MVDYVGTLYLVRPDAHTYEDPSEGVVDEFEGARRLIDVAAELWRLVEEEKHATAIEALVTHAYERKPYGLDANAIADLLRLTDGLDNALRAKIVDDQLRVRADQLPELRRRTELLDFDENRGALACEAVAEGMAGVMSLRSILKQARDQKLHIAFG